MLQANISAQLIETLTQPIVVMAMKIGRTHILQVISNYL